MSEPRAGPMLTFRDPLAGLTSRPQETTDMSVNRSGFSPTY